MTFRSMAMEFDALQLYFMHKLHLKEMRRIRQMSQETLAEHLDVTATQISRIETGKSQPSLAQIYALAEILNCDVVELLKGPGSPVEAKKPISVDDFCSMVETAEKIFEQVRQENGLIFKPKQKADAYKILLQTYQSGEEVNSAAVTATANALKLNMNHGK